MTKKEEEIAAALQWYDGGSPLQMELAKEYYAAMLKGEKAIKELADSYNNTAKAGGILQLEVIQLMIELETLMKLQNKTKSTTVPQSYTTPLKTLYSAYKKYASDIYPDTYAAFLEAPIIAFCTVLIDNGIDELIKETSDTWGRLQEIRQLTEAAATIRRGMESPGGFAVLSVIKDTRALQGINTKRQGKENGSAWEVKLKGGSGTFTLENYKELKRSFTAFTNKVFALTNIYYTQQNKITPTGTIKNIVEIPLEEIAKHLNRGTSPKSIKRLQEDLLDELATIRASSIRGKGYVTGISL